MFYGSVIKTLNRVSMVFSLTKSKSINQLSWSLKTTANQPQNKNQKYICINRTTLMLFTRCM
ncbi:MAG: hypothetical protein ACTS8Y_01370 [Arsenophonus sp. ER-EMS1-MAG3]